MFFYSHLSPILSIQSAALELVNDLILAGSSNNSTRYATYRWAMRLYCTRVDPPQVEAAEEVLDMVSKSLGGKILPDRLFYYHLLQGYTRLRNYDRVIELYRNLPKKYQGGDGAALTTLAYSAIKRPDMLPGLIQAITKGTSESLPDGKQQSRQPEVITPEILVELLLELSDKGEWTRAKEVSGILLERGMATLRSDVLQTAVDVITPMAEEHEEAQEVVIALELLLSGPSEQGGMER